MVVRHGERRVELAYAPARFRTTRDSSTPTTMLPLTFSRPARGSWA